MDMQHLREFVTLAETLSYTRTAELLYVSQSAVSRHISAMEEELGTRLVERDTRHVELTDSGRIAYERFKPIVERYAQAIKVLSNGPSQVTGRIVISSPYYFTEKFTEPIVRYFSTTNPRSEVQLISCQPIEGFEQMRVGTSDIVLTMHMARVPEGIEGVAFGREPLGVVMSATNPLAYRTSVSLAELTYDTVIVLDQSSYGIFQSASSKFVSDFIPPEARLVEVDQIDMVALAVQQTGGIAILPYEVRHMDRSYVRTVKIEEAQASMSMSLYWRTDNDNPVIPAFLDAVRATFPKMPEQTSPAR